VIVVGHAAPIHAAAMQGHSEACDRLLAAGADPNVQTQPQGYTSLHSASWGGHLDAVKILWKFGARKDLKNYRNESPEDTADRQGHVQVVDTLRTP
jgi:cytohesin